jgi:hypothetical protein
LGKFRQSSPELNERLPVQFGISPFADENPRLVFVQDQSDVANVGRRRGLAKSEPPTTLSANL